MHEVDLKLTGPAKRLLRQCIESMEVKDPVAAVIWTDGGMVKFPDGREETCPPSWGVGWYSIREVAGLEIQEIEGFKFIFGQGEKSQELNGRVLDANAGQFEIL